LRIRPIILTLLACAAYAAAFFLLRAPLGPAIGSLSLLPVLVAAYFFGARGGLLAGLLAFPLNTLLANLAGEPGWDALLRQGGGPGNLMLILAGGVAGWLSDTRRALRRQMDERERAEAQMRLQAAALDSSANTILITDREGVIQYVNPAFTALTGYTPAEALGQTPRLLKSGAHDQAFYKRLWDTILAGQVWRSEIVNRRRDGALFTVEQVITPVRGEGGAITHFVAIELDVTARKQRERELEAMAALSAALRAAPTLDEMLPRLLDETLAIVGTDAGVIWLYDPASGELREAAARGWFTQLDHTPMKPGEGIAGSVFVAGEARLFREFAREPLVRESSRPRIPFGWGGAGLPIRSTTQIVGVLFVAVPLPRELTPPEVHLLSALAEIAGNAIQRIRLHAETVESLRREQRLNEIARLIGGTLDLPTLLQNVVRLTAELIGAEAGAMALVAPDGQTMTYPYLFNLPEGLALAPTPRGQGMAWRIVAGGETVLLPDYGAHPGALPQWVAAGVHGFVGVPILAGEARLGALGLFGLNPARRFTERDAALAEAVGRQAGIAIQNAQLFKARQWRVEALTALHETGFDLSAQLDLPTLLRTITERAARLLQAPGGGLYLLQPDGETLELVVSHNNPRDYTSARLRLGEGLSGRIAQTGEPLIVGNYREWPGRARLYDEAAFGAIVGAPIRWQGKVLGVINVNDARPDRFGPEDAEMLSLFADQAAVAIANARLFEENQRRAERLAALHEIDRAISAGTDLTFTLNVLLEQAAARLGVDAADILLYDPARLTLDYAAGRGFRTAALRHTRLRPGEGCAGRAVLERRILHIPDLRVRRTDFLRSPLLAAEGFVAYYAAPLIAKGNIVGVLEIFHRAPLSADDEWLRFLDTLAGQAAIAVENAQLFTGLQRANVELMLAYDTTLEGWSRALELRDEETQGHTRRVTELTLRLARALGMSEEQIVHVRRGALLHDIGKMGVPDSILLKPGPLTEAEWAVMRNHPIYAYGLLQNIAYLRPALDIPYCHHEKWDGAGYPRGLAGEAIPLAARLFAVADVWDALTSDRPYRPAWSKEKALEYIREQSGRHFDPQVVEVFLREV
jgi:PAS domain S-box-containing protein